MDYLETIKKLKLKTYSENSFKKYWMNESDFGTSRRKHVHKQSIIEVYELWRSRLICRLFYLEEGCINRQIYHKSREITRYVAGCNEKLISGIGAGLSGITPYLFEYLRTYYLRWNISKFNSFVPISGAYGYSFRTFNWIQYNDYEPLLKRSIHKYSAASMLYDQKNDYPDTLFEYLAKYDKHPELEMIIKMKMAHLLKETHLMRWSKKSFLDILGIEQTDIPYLQGGLSLKFFRKYKHQIIGEKFTVEESCILQKYHQGVYKDRGKHIKMWNKRTLEYLQRHDVGVYSDYLRFAEELGYEIHRNRVLYPADLKEAHDKAFKQKILKESKESEEAFLKQYKKHKKMIFQEDGLMIFPVKNQAELIQESEALKHCVRSYAEDVAKGETEIFFVRREEEPDKPFVTVELKRKRVVQARGYKNNIVGNPLEESVKLFLSKWAKKHKIKYAY